MKFFATLVITALSLNLVGCDDEVPNPAAPPQAPPSVPQPVPNPPSGVPGTEASDAGDEPITGDQVQRELGEAADATGKYVGQKSEAWLKAAERRIAELDEQTRETRRELADKAEHLSAEAKARYEKAIKDLEDEKQAAIAYWESLKEKSGPAWEEARQGFEAAMTEAAEGLRRAKAWLNGSESADPAETPEPTNPPSP